jgi:protein-S-isoprenylcysteine O-methyltransferase Ste14
MAFVLRHVRAIVALPGTVTVFVPAVIVACAGARSAQDLPSWATVALVAMGCVLLGIGLALMTWTITLFARLGRGTLAPWDPPGTLVVRGPYRHVRNPMISGVTMVLLAESLLFRSLLLLIWCAAFAALNAIYIPLSEEPGLAARFGVDFDVYRRHVRRWLPRLRSWGETPGPDAP